MRADLLVQILFILKDELPKHMNLYLDGEKNSIFHLFPDHLSRVKLLGMDCHSFWAGTYFNFHIDYSCVRAILYHFLIQWIEKRGIKRCGFKDMYENNSDSLFFAKPDGEYMLRNSSKRILSEEKLNEYRKEIKVLFSAFKKD